MLPGITEISTFTISEFTDTTTGSILGTREGWRWQAEILKRLKFLNELRQAKRLAQPIQVVLGVASDHPAAGANRDRVAVGGAAARGGYQGPYGASPAWPTYAGRIRPASPRACAAAGGPRPPMRPDRTPATPTLRRARTTSAESSKTRSVSQTWPRLRRPTTCRGRRRCRRVPHEAGNSYTVFGRAALRAERAIAPSAMRAMYPP